MDAIRRPELDWIRVLAFGLLIPFHAGLGFIASNPYGFHNNKLAGLELVVPLLWVHQWRLPLLFIIAGMGAAYAFHRRPGLSFLRERTRRVLVPLVASTLLLLPIHTFLIAGNGSFPSFLLQWWKESGVRLGRVVTDPLPLWDHVQHLWFLLNLVLYAVLFLVLHRIASPEFRQRAVQTARRLLQMPAGAGLLLGALPLVVVEVAAKPAERGDVGTGYEFPYYFLVFLYGILLAHTGDALWRGLVKARWTMLATGILTMSLWSLLLYQADHVRQGYGFLLTEGGWTHWGFPWIDAYTGPSMVLHAVNAWAWVVAFLGWGARYLTWTSPTLQYLNAAHFTSYIVHLSFVLLGIHLLKDQPVPWPLKFLLITLATALLVLAFYEGVRRTRLTRLLFGARQPRPAPQRRDPPPQA